MATPSDLKPQQDSAGAAAHIASARQMLTALQEKIGQHPELGAAITLIEKGDPGLNDVGRASLSALSIQLRNSIGFFEGQREENILRVHFSGALVRADLPLQILSDELDIPCELWDPFEKCEISLPRNKRDGFHIDQHQLNVACGAAIELLRAEN